MGMPDGFPESQFMIRCILTNQKTKSKRNALSRYGICHKLDMSAEIEIARRRLAPLWAEDGEQSDSWEALEERLAVVLEDWLAHRFAELTQLAYRLDLPEERFHAALQGRSLQEAARSLAGAFIEREIQRAETRARWNQADGSR